MRTGRLLALVLVGLGGLAGGGVVAAVAASATPSSFALVFEGGHVPGVGPGNLQHEGSFTASAPACSAGQATDVRFVYPAAMLREYRCDDGSGAFTALVDSIEAEHGGPGVWRIMGGSGRYARLRGQGTFASEFVSGSPREEASIAFRSTWTGLAAFDDLAPEIEIVRASAARLRRPQGAYLLRIALSVRDDLPGNAVEYLMLPSSDSSRLPFRAGRTTSGSVSLAVQVRPPRGERRLLLEIRATDPVGNERRIVRSLRLPG